MASRFPVLLATIIFLVTGLVTSQTTPGCSSNECEKPTTSAGLSITNDKPCYANGDKLTYVCTGTSFGPSENFCDGSSGWRYDHPVCKESDISCPSINTPQNGIINNKRDNYTIYQAVDIACNAGYTLVGASRKVCDLDGKFKPLYDPICTESLSVPQTSRPTTSPVMTTSSDITTASSISTLSASPSSTEPSTEPTSDKKTEPPASSLNPPEGNWNGLIIGLCAGVGGGILIVVFTLVLSNCYAKHAKKMLVEPGAENLEMNGNEYQFASTNKSFSDTWG